MFKPHPPHDIKYMYIYIIYKINKLTILNLTHLYLSWVGFRST